MNKSLFKHHYLDKDHLFWTGVLPDDLHFNSEDFEKLWQMHPDSYHEIKIRGQLAKTPRWQQAYGKDYYYTGNLNKALPVPPLLEDVFSWCKTNIDERLNGILLNWYDASLKHYIGKHRDSTINMVVGSPIVTISFGEERLFRLRPWRGDGFKDFMTFPGSIFIMPYTTNENWTHEVPMKSRYTNKRISITLRAFDE